MEELYQCQSLEILVVEDDFVTRMIVDRFFKKVVPRASVTTVTDGSHALKLLQEGRVFDLVVSDVFMPGLSGLDLMDQLKKLPQKETPVIFMSVTKRVEVVNNCWRKGAANFISKPLKFKEMQECIKNVLKRSLDEKDRRPLSLGIKEISASLADCKSRSLKRSQSTSSDSSGSSSTSDIQEVNETGQSKRARVEAGSHECLAKQCGETSALCNRCCSGASRELSEARVQPKFSSRPIPIAFQAAASITCLPEDILTIIFSFCEGQDLRRVSQVCKDWRSLVYGQSRLAKEAYWAAWARLPHNLDLYPDWRARNAAMASTADNWRTGRHRVVELERSASIAASAGRMHRPDKRKAPAVAVATSARHTVSANGDGTVLLWEHPNSDGVPTANKKIMLRPDGVRAIPFLQLKESSLVCGYKDGVVISWSLEFGEWEWRVQMHATQDSFEGMHMRDNQLLAWGRSPDIHIWDITAQTHVRTLSGLRRRITSLDTDGKGIMTASSDHQAILWDFETGAKILQLGGVSAHKSPINGIQLAHDRLLTCSSDRTVKVWDRRCGQCTALLYQGGHRGPVTCLSYDPHAQLAVSGGADGFVCIWDLRAAHESCRVRLEERSGVGVTALAADVEKVVTAHRDGEVKTWSFKNL